MMKNFIQNDDTEWVILDDKVRRKVLSHDPSLMLVKVEFQAGAFQCISWGPLYRRWGID